MRLIKLSLFFGAAFFSLLTGCAKQDESTQQAEVIAVQEEETEAAVAAASPEPQSGYVEYMWCGFGRNVRRNMVRTEGRLQQNSCCFGT